MYASMMCYDLNSIGQVKLKLLPLFSWPSVLESID